MANPVYVRRGENPPEAGSRESDKPLRWWAAEYVERRKGCKGKPGAPGTDWGNLIRSLYSLSHKVRPKRMQRSKWEQAASQVIYWPVRTC